MELIDVTNLPDVVVQRLAANDVDAAEKIRAGRRAETRRFKLELREDAQGNPVIEGYATVYEYPYDIAGGPPVGYVETIARGAADASVKRRDDVRLLVNHEGSSLARTTSQSLHLESDDTGLFVRASLATDSPAAQTVVSALRRGDMDEMSFAFKAIRQEWNDDYTERRITEVKLYDVSVVDYPANPATVVQLRADERANGMRLSAAIAEASRLRGVPSRGNLMPMRDADEQILKAVERALRGQSYTRATTTDGLRVNIATGTVSHPQ